MNDSYETFTEEELNLLSRFVSHPSSNVFVLRNLPEVIKGALFSRYSRSTLGLRSLLLKEFIPNDDTAFRTIVGSSESTQEQSAAIQKAQSFYDRILDGYGDDSIGELGGAHLAIENISMLAAKEIEDCRIGGSPLEKSTRYIYFDQKINGEYLFYREPVLMTSAFRDLFLATCNDLYDIYSELIPPLLELIEQSFPKDPLISKTAYTAALRAKVLDCLRGLLPAGALTNMGVFGNGRFFEQLIQKLQCHRCAEMQDLGRKSYEELSKVIPSFVRRAHPTHPHHLSYVQFIEKMQSNLKKASQALSIPLCTQENIRLIRHNPDCVADVAGALFFSQTTGNLLELQKLCRTLPSEEIDRLFHLVASPRKNRRHKSPRALEHASFTFEIMADFGVYRDLHRHRMLTQERQLLSCHYGYHTPPEILGTPLEARYREAMEKAKKAYDAIAPSLPEEAQYLVPMAYHVRWYFTLNLRAAQWLTELRSQAAGHPTYRWIAQEMARQICEAYPPFKPLFRFVDYTGHALGRLEQEIRTEAKKQHVSTPI